MSDSESEHSDLSLGASDKEETPVPQVMERKSRGVVQPYSRQGSFHKPNPVVYSKPINISVRQTVKDDLDKSSGDDNLDLCSDDERKKEAEAVEELPEQKRRNSGLFNKVKKPDLSEFKETVRANEQMIINNNYNINVNIDNKRDGISIKFGERSNKVMSEAYIKKTDNQPIRLMGMGSSKPIEEKPVDLRSSGLYNFGSMMNTSINTNTNAESDRISLRQSSNMLKQSIKFEEQEFDKGYEIYKNPRIGASIYDKLTEEADGYDDEIDMPQEEYEEAEEEEDYQVDDDGNNFEKIDECDEENLDEVSELDANEQSMLEREFLKEALIESNKQYVKGQMVFEDKIKKCASRIVFIY
jgi:hypothetical protein